MFGITGKRPLRRDDDLKGNSLPICPFPQLYIRRPQNGQSFAQRSREIFHSISPVRQIRMVLLLKLRNHDQIRMQLIVFNLDDVIRLNGDGDLMRKPQVGKYTILKSAKNYASMRSVIKNQVRISHMLSIKENSLGQATCLETRDSE